MECAPGRILEQLFTRGLLSNATRHAFHCCNVTRVTIRALRARAAIWRRARNARIADCAVPP
eukprot:11226431-Lingulodinium_polyedra.AAC.1